MDLAEVQKVEGCVLVNDNMHGVMNLAKIDI